MSDSTRHFFKSDERDAMRCAYDYLAIKRCAGDRLIVDGYVCPHCDSSNPSRTCLEPKQVADVFAATEPKEVVAVPILTERSLPDKLRYVASQLVGLAKVVPVLHGYVQALEALVSEVETAAEYKQTFDTRWKADMRAIRRWHEAGNPELVWPDHADLTVWLLEQLREMEARSIGAFWLMGPEKDAGQLHAARDKALAMLKAADDKLDREQDLPEYDEGAAGFARAWEREACAKLCDAAADNGDGYTEAGQGAVRQAEELGRAIRART